MEDNLVSLSQKIGEKRQKISMKKLDMAASYATMEKCLFYLDMNKLAELDDVKNELKKAMKLLAELSK